MILKPPSRKKNCQPIEVVSSQPNWVELLVPCTREAVDDTQGFLATLDADLPQELRDMIRVAARELMYNAVEWGGNLDPDQRVRVVQMRLPRLLVYRIADPGEGFTFEGMRHASTGEAKGAGLAAIARAREKLGIRPGGLGIAMSRAIADEIIYNEKQNEVVMIKYLK